MKPLRIEDKCLSKMEYMGWTPINRKAVYINRANNINSDSLNDFFGSKLTNKSNQLNKVFNILYSNLSDDLYKSQINKMKDIINIKSEYCSLMFMCLMLILDKLQGKYGKNQQNEHLSSGNVIEKISSANRKKRNLLDKEIRHNHITIEQYIKKSQIMLITEYDFKFYKCIFRKNKHRFTKNMYGTYKGMPLNRNAVAHGNFSKYDLSYTNFLKLLLLCKNISTDFKHSRSKI